MTAATNSPQKKSIPYIEILKQAGRIVWQNRYLLWFGLLMALGSPGSFNVGNNNDFGSQGDTAKNFFALHWGIVLALVIILFAIGIILFLISLVAKAGLVKSVNLVAQNKKKISRLAGNQEKNTSENFSSLPSCFFWQYSRSSSSWPFP